MNKDDRIKHATIIAAFIRDIKEVPAGHIYAAVMDRMSIDEFQSILMVLEHAKLIKQRGWLLTWTGPAIKES